MVSTPIDELMAHARADLDAVEQLLREQLAAMPLSIIEQVGSHLVLSGGKRLRPLLTLSCAELCAPEIVPSADQRAAIHRLAVCVELIHSATLLHDDVVDESPLRRGKPSAPKAFGNSATVLVGDALLALAFQLLAELESPAIMQLFATTSAAIAVGELHQLVRLRAPELGAEEYWQVVEHKTASLFSTACVAGLGQALPSGGGREDGSAAQRFAYHLDRFGHHLGRAYQVLDDVLDYGVASAAPLATRVVLGKRTGDDYSERKITAPVVAAIGACSASPDDAQRQAYGVLAGYFLDSAGAAAPRVGGWRRAARRWTGASTNGSGGDVALHEVVASIRTLGGFAIASQWVRDELTACRQHLHILPDGGMQARLEGLLLFVEARLP